ncbi:hypothetical protein GCM10010431_20100 [Streptomyces kunmingensis]
MSGRIVAWVAAWDIQWCRKVQAGAVSVGMGDSSGVVSIGAPRRRCIGARCGIVPINPVAGEASWRILLIGNHVGRRAGPPAVPSARKGTGDRARRVID